MMRRVVLLALTLAAGAGCATTPPVVHYTVTTKSRLVCCRTMQFQVGQFASTMRATGQDTGLVVRLVSAGVTGDCERGAEVPVLMANHSDRDLYIPFSHELEGDRLRLYPWRLWRDSASGAIRLARQIQYGDLFEHTDARLRLMLLPAGRQIHLTGFIPPEWLCTPPTQLYEGYLEAELDPAFYAQRSRGLRTSRFDQARDVASPIGLRYDVVSTALEFLDHLPVTSRRWSKAGDSVAIEIDVPEEPEKFMLASQRVSSSNVVQLSIDGTKGPRDSSSIRR